MPELNRSILDPVETAKLIVGAIMSPQLAEVVGPYSVIALAAIGGAAYRLGDISVDDRRSSIKFFVRATVLPILLTVPVSTLAAKYVENWETQWFFVPTAALLAYTADRWGEFIAEGITGLKSLVKSWAERGNKQ